MQAEKHAAHMVSYFRVWSLGENFKVEQSAIKAFDEISIPLPHSLRKGDLKEMILGTLVNHSILQQLNFF